MTRNVSTTKLDRISQFSAQGEKIYNLAYLLNVEFLTECYRELEPNKAAGIDEVSKAEYGEFLRHNLEDLVARLKNGTYHPRPRRRKWLPKPGTNKKRPIDISCFEDKIVERAIAKILNAIYEPKFLRCSFGFRPHLSCHHAISKLLSVLNLRTSYVVEADFRSFFNTIPHDKLMGFLEKDIADRRFLKLIRLGLEQGHLEDGIYYDDTTGTAQGSGYSPVLANVYLHYVLDTWVYELTGRLPGVHINPRDRIYGDCELVRYADDYVVAFQRLSDAQKFYSLLQKRVEEYGLSLAPEKTRILPFGRFAEDNRARYGKALGYGDQRPPETFDFLGFTFYNSTSYWRRDSHGNPQYCAKVKTIGKRMRRKLQEQKAWMRKNRNMRLKDVVAHMNSVLVGYYNYYAVTCNSRCVNSFRFHLEQIIFKWMNRRSQKRSFNWKKFRAILARTPLEPAKIRVDIYRLHKAA